MKSRWAVSAALAVVAFVFGGATAAVAAPRAGAVKSTGPVRWSAPRVVEDAPPFGVLSTIGGVACPTATTCLGVGRGGAVLTMTPSATGVAVVASRGLAGAAGFEGISCPSASLCVAYAERTLVVSRNPTDPDSRWRRVAPAPHDDAYWGVACPTARRCVAWTDSSTLQVSSDPAGGSGSWRQVQLPGRVVDAVGCVTGTTKCVASISSKSGGRQAFATTSDLTGRSSAWHITRAPGLTRLAQIECPSSALCVGLGAYPSRTLETTVDPAAGARAWRSSMLKLSGAGPLGTNAFALGCVSADECLITLDDGSVASSSDPAGGAGTYVQSGVVDGGRFGGYPGEIGCPTASTCLVPAAQAGIDTVDVGPPVSATTQSGLAGQTAVTGLACPAVRLCVGVDNSGEILDTAQPAGPAGGWQRTPQPGTSQLSAVSCPTISFCAAVGDDDTILTTASPSTASTWQLTRLKLTYEIDTQDPPGPFPYDLESVSCPSSRLCVVGTDFQGVIVSTQPTAGPSAWRYERVVTGDDEHLDAVSCPTTSLCLAGDNDGDIAFSTRPRASTNTWKSFRLGRPKRGPQIRSLSCPDARLCVAGDAAGALEVSTDPTRGPRAWHRVALHAGAVTGAWCRSARSCIVVGAGAAYATTHPTGPRRAWHRVALHTPAQRRLRAVTCAPTSTCLATGGGSVFPGAG